MTLFYETLKTKIDEWNQKSNKETSKEFSKLDYNIYNIFGKNPKIHIIGTHPYNNKNLELNENNIILNASQEIFIPSNLQNLNINPTTINDDPILNKEARDCYRILSQYLRNNNITKIKDEIINIDKILEENYKTRAKGIVKSILEKKENILQFINVTDIISGFITDELKTEKISYISLLPKEIDLNQDKLYSQILENKGSFYADPLKVWDPKGAEKILKASLKDSLDIVNKLKNEIDEKKLQILKTINPTKTMVQ